MRHTHRGEKRIGNESGGNQGIKSISIRRATVRGRRVG